MNNVQRPRHTFIGGSDVASIIGVSPYRTPVELWMQKRSGIEQNDSPVLRRGRRLEPYVRDIFADESGRVVLPPRFVQGTEPWQCVSLDGESAGRDFYGSNLTAEEMTQVIADRVLEIKTANEFTRRDWGDAGTDEVPVYYTAQCQWAMLITGHKMSDLAALIGLDDFRIYAIEADVEIQTMLLARATEFWQRVQDGTPPDPVDAADVSLLYPVHESGLLVEAQDNDLDNINELRQIRKRIDADEQRADLLKFSLMQRIGAGEGLAIDGRPIVTWKAQESRKFDLKAFRAAHPDLAEQFTRAQSTRVFRIK